MSVPLTGAGGLFTRLGHLINMLTVSNTFRGTTIPALVATAVEDLATGDPADSATVNGLAAGVQSGLTPFTTGLQSAAQSIVIEMVNADVVQPDTTFPTAMKTLIAQMIAGSHTVQRNTVSVSVSPTSGNVGNPVIVSTILGSNGLPLEYCFPESILATCTADSQSGSATALREPLSFVGQQTVSSTTDWRYPGGSGVSKTLNCVDALQSQSSTGNWLNNGSFETYVTTPNVPDNFHVLTGTTPGTNLLQTGTSYDGSYAIKFVGDGSTTPGIYQAFGVDTSQKLSANSVYAFVCWLQFDVVPAAGVLTISLTDGAGSVTSDTQGNNNAVTKTLSAATTTYAPFSGVFRTPKAIPASGLRLQVKVSTAISSGSVLFIDRLAFAPMTQFYSGGPAFVAFGANTPLVIGDSFTVTVSNSRNGLLTSGCDSLLPMRSNGLVLPSVASGANVPDSLVD